MCAPRFLENPKPGRHPFSGPITRSAMDAPANSTGRNQRNAVVCHRRLDCIPPGMIFECLGGYDCSHAVVEAGEYRRDRCVLICVLQVVKDVVTQDQVEFPVDGRWQSVSLKA
jgi:hypothetical protein